MSGFLLLALMSGAAGESLRVAKLSWDRSWDAVLVGMEWTNWTIMAERSSPISPTWRTRGPHSSALVRWGQWGVTISASDLPEDVSSAPVVWFKAGPAGITARGVSAWEPIETQPAASRLGEVSRGAIVFFGSAAATFLAACSAAFVGSLSRRSSAPPPIPPSPPARQELVSFPSPFPSRLPSLGDSFSIENPNNKIF